MTGGAILPESAVVLVILLVARETILRRRLQIRKGTRIEVTFCTSRFGMFAAQLKCKRGMGKVAPKPVHAIVTGEAVRAKSQQMRLRKNNIHLTMTSIAGRWDEGRDIFLMTIPTGERFARRCQRVPFQRESQRLMRKGKLPHLGQRSGFAAMFRVAVAAGKRGGTFIHDCAVQFRHILHLFGNVCMASHTAICHAFSPQRKNVASRTFLNLRVRSRAAVNISRLRIQRAR